MPFILQEIEATDRGGTCWWHADTLTACENLDVPLQWQYYTHVSLYLFICQDFNFLSILERKERQRNPSQAVPLHAAADAWD